MLRVLVRENDGHRAFSEKWHPKTRACQGNTDAQRQPSGVSNRVLTMAHVLDKLIYFCRTCEAVNCRQLPFFEFWWPEVQQSYVFYE